MAGKRDLLASIPLFSACSGREIAQISALAARVYLAEGEVLVQQGDPGRSFSLIARGSASVTVNGNRRKDLGPGDFFGEMALLDPAARSAQVLALKPVTLYMIKDKDFSRMLDTSPSIVSKMLAVLAQRLRAAEGGPDYSWNR